MERLKESQTIGRAKINTVNRPQDKIFINGRMMTNQIVWQTRTNLNLISLRVQISENEATLDILLATLCVIMTQKTRVDKIFNSTLILTLKQI